MFNCECGADLIQEDCETILDVCQEAPVVKDYETLANKPQINGVTLDGNKTSEDLGITQEIADAVSAEATLRENADTALGGRIDDEATARENADTALGGRIDGEITNRTNADNALGTRIDNEILARQGGDNNLQTQIDAITSKSDVVDVVADYAALQAYDTQHLGNNDVIKVLDDETHDDAQTYYRWNKTAGTWSYIGSEAPYYSKGQMDTMLQAKQDKLIAGTNIQIAQDGKTISATDTTYTAGNGLNLNGTEFSADTTVLATKEDLDNYYTKTETDTKLAPKLEAEVVAELPSTGTEGKLYLTPKNYTTGTATGNPITISLGEDAGQITSAQLDGDTYQQSYTGKNLFKYEFESATSQSGLTFGYDEKTCTLTVSGTASAEWVAITKNSTQGVNTINLAAGTTVSFYCNISGSGILSATMRVRNTSTPSVATDDLSSSSGYTTKTLANDDNYMMLWLRTGGSGTTVNAKLQLQVTKSATPDSDIEPYVGGVPSPNPDYPQQIQTVTGEQTVEVVGKNIFNPEATPWVQKVAYNENGEKVTWTGYYGIAEYQPVVPNTTYYFSNSLGKGIYYGLVYYDANREKISNVTSTTRTFTTPANCYYIRFAIGSNVTEAPTWTQLELGSTASSYTPYSKQTLPISLGSIELCKLGTYQDYIYKSGSDWKVHKATNKTILDGSNEEGWQLNTAYPTEYMCNKANAGVTAPSGSVASVCSDFIVTSVAPASKGKYRIGGSYLPFNYDNGDGGVESFKTWLSQHNVTVYTILATPTDTEITDQTLIAQLEAVSTALLQNGANNITNTATGSNLAGDMELGYYEYNPTNRYDKWLWLDINNNYEKLGS